MGVVIVEVEVDVVVVLHGAVAQGVELFFIHAGVVAEFVEEGFADFLLELIAGGAGLEERPAVDHDARGEVAGVAAFVEAVADVEAEGAEVVAGVVVGVGEGVFVGGAGAVFDDDGDFVDPACELVGEGGDDVFQDAVEGVAGEVEDGGGVKWGSG
jgi:hypothetical protein